MDRRVSFTESTNSSVPPSPFYNTGAPLLFSHKPPALKKPEEVLDGQKWWNKILDPSSEAVLRWNHVFLVATLIALFVDPLFFFLPVVDAVSAESSGSFCMMRSVDLGVAVTFFRTLADLFYMLHVVIKFRTAFVARNSTVFGRGELVTDPYLIARRYILSDFCIDFVAALPLPQIVIWFIIPSISSFHSSQSFNALELVVFIQYIPRLYLLFPLSAQITKTTGVVTKTAWAGAAYNLLLYMLASHILGASWYLLSIERQSTCWKSNCKLETGCFLDYLDCQTRDNADRISWANNTQVFSNCDPTNTNSTFNFGIYTNAVSKHVVTSDFLDKYFYCLWWGLQNLSSYGQNLMTTTLIMETTLCIVISILGLVLFAQLIGNMQTYLQSITLRLEEWRLKRRDTEEWMRHRQLPQNLRGRVRRYLQYKWLTTRGVDEESILFSLPTDLRRDIQRHLCLDLVRRVPLFAKMDAQLLDAMCERLRSSLSIQGTFIVREDDPVTEMLFIIRGQLESSTTNGGRTGFFNSTMLGPGDFCGEELLAWALVPKSTMPSSTRTVRALVEVEAFALSAEDLKFVANQFRRLHSRKLQHTFRYYSHHWRTWAACFIQAAWRQHTRRELTKSLSLTDSLSDSPYDAYDDCSPGETKTAQDVNVHTTRSSQAMQNLGTSVLPEKYTANTKKVGQKSEDLELFTFAKPEEPDFSADPHDD